MVRILEQALLCPCAIYQTEHYCLKLNQCQNTCTTKILKDSTKFCFQRLCQLYSSQRHMRTLHVSHTSVKTGCHSHTDKAELVF